MDRNEGGLTLAAGLSDIVRQRLSNQFLGSRKCRTAREAVGKLGAIQSQDYGPAKWAIGMRVANATDAIVEDAFTSGEILRTHVLRPTWHFVLPKDLRWMIELSAPRVRAVLRPYDRKLRIDRKTLSRSFSVIENAVGDGRHLTREELAAHLAEKGITAAGQRLAHIVMHAELSCLLCSGPRRGKRFTYAFFDDRAPRSLSLSRDEALHRLAATYFSSHGPAQARDFAWWAGMTLRDAERAVESAAESLSRETVRGVAYWGPRTRQSVTRIPKALLVSVYDEYVIAYKDRAAVDSGGFTRRLLAMGNALTSLILLNGTIAGTWKRTAAKEGMIVTATLFRRLSTGERNAIESQARALARFTGSVIQLEVKQ